jgi:hypothetical protein
MIIGVRTDNVPAVNALARIRVTRAVRIARAERVVRVILRGLSLPKRLSRVASTSRGSQLTATQITLKALQTR